MGAGRVERGGAVHAAGKVRGVAIDDAYRLAPWADVLYFADARWANWQQDRPEFRAFSGLRCSIENSAPGIEDDAVHILRNRDFPNHGLGLSLDPRALVTGRNSGFQALNLAILAGAKTVILLGFDGRPNSEGKTHFHAGHPKPTPTAVYEEYRRSFSAAESAIEAAAVKVLNCSPGTFIDSFSKVALEDALARYDRLP